MKDHIYDVIIIGAGPIGLACSIQAQERNLKYLVIEKGCLVNSLFHYPTNMTFFSTSDRLEIGGVPFISHGVKPTRAEALEYYRRVKESRGLNVNTYELVHSINKNDEFFFISSNKALYKTYKVIISTGFFDYAKLMNIPGEDLPKVKHYYDEPHPYAAEKIIVVGGGNSAVDVALETYRRGSQVTMILKKNNLDDGVKYWVRPDIENRINEGAIKAYFNSYLKEIRENEVIVQTPERLIVIENDFVLAMTGYHPDFAFLESCGINFRDDNSKIPLYDETTFETNIKGIYLAGVVCGGMDTGKWFIENSIYHAENIFEHISLKKE
ncbi:MAG: YpdA family putative bacillithiol disulfide reductase [Bacteroidetes bacterium]|nr:YpdA family putative bacillithiol disulfide reductase [Bacteroidota bacterium]